MKPSLRIARRSVVGVKRLRRTANARTSSRIGLKGMMEDPFGQPLQHVGYLLQRPLDLSVGNDVRRHEVHDVPEWTEQQATLQKRRGKSGADRIEVSSRRFRFLVSNQLHDPDAPDDTDISNVR